MNFWIYLVGMVVVIAGIGWGLSTAHVSSTWTLIICMILLGIGIVKAVTHTRQKDPPTG